MAKNYIRSIRQRVTSHDKDTQKYQAEIGKYKNLSEENYKKYLISKVTCDRFFGYQKWLVKNYPKADTLGAQTTAAQKLKYKPKISILIPVYKTPHDLLRECFDSVINQTYDNWQLCVVDDRSQDPEITAILSEYEQKFPGKFKFSTREVNGHISKASNDALGLADGDFIALLDHDDVLWPNALYEVVELLNKDKKIDFIYTDEDKLEDGIVHAHPYTKPSYNKFFLSGCNYITHFAVIRADLMRKIGGFREGVEGAQDWDIFLRTVAQTDRIVHLPKLVYSWRVIETSTAKGGFEAKPYAYDAQRKAVMDFYEAAGVSVVDAELPFGYVGWMVKFAPTKTSLGVVIDQVSSVEQVVTLVARIEAARTDSVDITYYVVADEFHKSLASHESLRDLQIEFISDQHGVSFGTESILYLKGISDVSGVEGWLNNLLGYIQLDDVDVVALGIRYSDHIIVSAGVLKDERGEHFHLLEGYLQGCDQRLDTNLLSPRGVELPDGRAFLSKSSRLGGKVKLSQLRGMESLADDKHLSTVYVPFAITFLNEPHILSEDARVEEFTEDYKLPAGNRYWGSSYLI